LGPQGELDHFDGTQVKHFSGTGVVE